MKIHIIGCSGSGKTYLANALSKKYNISHFDLDDIQWDNNAKEYGKKRTLDERKADPWIISIDPFFIKSKLIICTPIHLNCHLSIQPYINLVFSRYIIY